MTVLLFGVLGRAASRRVASIGRLSAGPFERKFHVMVPGDSSSNACTYDSFPVGFPSKWYSVRRTTAGR